MSHQDQTERGQIFRREEEERRSLSFIDAELSDAAEDFRKAASQLDNLITHQWSDLGPVLSRIDMDRVLKLVGERVEIKRALFKSAERLRRATDE